MTVFSEYFLASVQALMSNLTFDRLCFLSKFSTFDFLSSGLLPVNQSKLYWQSENLLGAGFRNENIHFFGRFKKLL